MTPQDFLAPLLGLLTAVLVGYLAGRRQSQFAYKKETRLAIAKLAHEMGGAIHTMAWTTWKANWQAAHFTREDVEQYDREMNSLYPSLTGALATVAAMSKTAYTELRTVVDKVYELDEQIAQATTAVKDGVKEAAGKVAAHYDAAHSIEREVLDEVTEIMARV